MALGTCRLPVWTPYELDGSRRSSGTHAVASIVSHWTSTAAMDLAERRLPTGRVEAERLDRAYSLPQF